MKYLKLTLTFFIAIDLCSYSNDDSLTDSDEKTTDLLVGIWQPIL